MDQGLTVNITRPAQLGRAPRKPFNRLIANASSPSTVTVRITWATRLQNIHFGKLDWRYLSGNEANVDILNGCVDILSG
jgi:hypothetical protein